MESGAKAAADGSIELLTQRGQLDWYRTDPLDFEERIAAESLASSFEECGCSCQFLFGRRRRLVDQCGWLLAHGMFACNTHHALHVQAICHVGRLQAIQPYWQSAYLDG